MSRCGGNCAGCAGCGGPIGIGSYGPVPPLGQPGYRLSIPGGPRGGQYHGLPSANLSGYDERGVFRAPGELPPRANASGDANILHVRHSRRLPGYAEVPGGLYPHQIGALPVTAPAPFRVGSPTICPAWGCNGPIDTVIRVPLPTSGATSVAPMPAPGSIAAPGPTVADNCASGQYRDAAGNCTDDWHNPYPIYLPAQPSPVVSADTSPTPTAGQVPSGSWLTDPTRELINGVPNWGILAAGAAVLMFMRGRR